MKMSRPRKVRTTLLACALAPAAIACSPAATNESGPHVASPQRQAESEYNLALDAFGKGHLREALDHAQLSNKLDDENAKALYFTAVIYMRFCDAEGMTAPDCRLQTAEELLRRTIKVDKGFRDAKNALGAVLLNEGKFAEALKVEEPLTKDPAYVANHLAWGNYGWALLELGRYDDAIAALRNSTTEPRFCVGKYRLGIAYEKKGDLVAAEESLGGAVTTPDANCEAMQAAWAERGRVRMKLGKTSEAQGDFARCRELDAKTDAGKDCSKLAGNAAPTPLEPLPPPPREGVMPAPAPETASSAGQP
jgi:tetratricopeptide (TPR) repeat protein